MLSWWLPNDFQLENSFPQSKVMEWNKFLGMTWNQWFIASSISLALHPLGQILLWTVDDLSFFLQYSAWKTAFLDALYDHLVFSFTSLGVWFHQRFFLWTGGKESASPLVMRTLILQENSLVFHLDKIKDVGERNLTNVLYCTTMKSRFFMSLVRWI